MNKKFLDLINNNFHFVGVGGVSMSGLAKHLILNGAKVSGSDNNAADVLEQLRTVGVKVYSRHSPSNVKGADVVVYTSAVSDDNCELKFAKHKKLTIYKRSELLGKILDSFQKSIAVSGSHGKTTATAMIAHALICAGVDPTVFLGGEDKTFGNYRNGESGVVVSEACEYKKNLLDLHADISVVLNIDNDHMDCYKNDKDVEETFAKFIGGSIAVVNADDKRCANIFNATTVTFGIEKIATYSAKKVKFNGKGFSFMVYAYSMPQGVVNLSVIGRHNVYNALATIAVCDLLKIPFSKVKCALESFDGVKRRAEFIGKFGDSEIFADYAHHPKEIKAVLEAFSQADKPYSVIFQPHTFSRTKLLMDDFVSVLQTIPSLVIYSTYPARESFDAEGSALKLFENLKHCGNCERFFASTERELLTLVRQQCAKYKKVLVLGAGNIYDLVKNIINSSIST